MLDYIRKEYLDRCPGEDLRDYYINRLLAYCQITAPRNDQILDQWDKEREVLHTLGTLENIHSRTTHAQIRDLTDAIEALAKLVLGGTE